MKKSKPIILVVDDDPNDLLFIQAAFMSVTATVRTVDSAFEAISYLAGEKEYSNRVSYPYPDFLITDLKMPGMDGFGLLKYLKQSTNYAIIPAVVFSGSQDNDDIRTAYLLGASSYHLKPSGLGELRGLIKTLHNFWTQCEIPAAVSGQKKKQVDALHKLGEEFSEYTHQRCTLPGEEIQSGVHPL